MRELVQDLRRVIARGSVDQKAVAEIQGLVQESVPRLQACLEGRASRGGLKPGRYLCYKDADYGFVVMVLVWGPGDGTAIHDHGTWGVEAVLRNALRITNYSECEVNPSALDSKLCESGEVISNMPPDRDVHKVEHASGDYAVSLHIYGREMTGNRMFVPGEGFKSCKLETRILDGLGVDSPTSQPCKAGA